MLESCDNRAGSEKRQTNMFRRHAMWPKVADAVIEARKYFSHLRLGRAFGNIALK